MKSKNEPVADIPCPFRGCDKSVPVYKFAARTDQRERQRFAGKMYCKCPVHGRCDDQEYILNSEQLQWRSEQKTEDAASENQPVNSEATSVQQQSQPVKPPPQKPVNKAPARVVKPAAPPVQQNQQRRWGYF